MMNNLCLMFLLLGVGLAHAGARDILSNGTVYLSFVIGQNSASGSGFVFFRPDDPSKEYKENERASGFVFLVTNKHVLPPEGVQCNLSMRVTTGSAPALATKVISIPIVGRDGRYVDKVHLHPKNDVAAVAVTEDILKGGMRLDTGFVFTTFLGTKDRLKKIRIAEVGDEVYILGYPAGIFDTRNANPVWRIGIIATNPLLGYAFPESLQKMFGLPSFVDGFLVDAQVYPGSSGSVVIYNPQANSFDGPGGWITGGSRSVPYVLGIISGSIPIVDSSLHLVTRMGLGIVQSADAINETIETFYAKK